jgi:hypothetical protein
VQEGILDKEQDGSARLKQLQASDVGTQLYDESGLKEKKIKHTMKPIVADNEVSLYALRFTCVLDMAQIEAPPPVTIAP